MSTADVSFDAMGCRIRLIVGDPLDPSLPAPAAAIDNSRRWLANFEAKLSRFRADSELCAMNSDARAVVEAGVLLRTAISAGIWSAKQTNGLVDPTLVGQLEASGYAESRAGCEPAPLAEALVAAPPRRPAAPSPEGRWRLVEVDDAAGVIRRPPGVRLDTGGAGKGLAVDALIHRLAGYSRVAVDCGGDVRVSGPDALTNPFVIEIEHPLDGRPAHALEVARGGIATSGIGTRIWRTGDGFAHHLIDPSTGRPAWTGLIQATAAGHTALEAEMLSKAALLSGADEARRILQPLGGALINDDGELELIGALEPQEALAA